MLPVLASIFSLSSLAHGIHDPIVAFTDAEYEGHGHYIDVDGARGDYHAFADITEDAWLRGLESPAGAKTYEYQFFFSDDASFDVEVLAHNHGHADLHVTDVPEAFFGHGYCMNMQCHIYIPLPGGFLEEAVSFWDGKFYAVGSVHITDELGVTGVSRWEEWLTACANTEEGGELIAEPIVTPLPFPAIKSCPDDDDGCSDLGE